MRRQLHDELHARPSLYFEAPSLVWHAAFHVGGPSSWVPHTLCGDAELTRDGKSGIAVCGNGQIKWEVHNEFISLTHVMPWSGRLDEMPEPDPAWAEVIGTVQGQLLVSVEVLVTTGLDDPRILLPGDGEAIASTVGGGEAEAWSTYRLGENGSIRIVLMNKRLNPYRTGRIVRRLLEIENYRMMALLSHPLSQEAFARCADFEKRLQLIVSALGDAERKAEALLAEIAKLSADILEFSTKTRVRFAATAAYADLVFARLEELRETRVEGHQRIGVFIDRRFRPAVRSCEQADKRIESAAVRVARASELLRTSVQVELEQQNAMMLNSVAQRVALQTKLQEAVEGFSIIAISYYLLGIIKVVLDGMGGFGEDFHAPKWIVVAAAPAVIFAVWFTVRRVKNSLTGGH